MPRLSQQQVETHIAEWSGSTSAIDVPEKATTGKPWEKDAAFHPEDVDGILLITLADGIYINAGNLKPRLQNQIRLLAAFKNPVFYKNLAMGIATFDTPRIIYLGSDVHIPHGLIEPLLTRLNDAGILYSIDDKRTQNKPLRISFNGDLREEQVPAVDALLLHDNGVLSAATAS